MGMRAPQLSVGSCLPTSSAPPWVPMFPRGPDSTMPAYLRRTFDAATRRLRSLADDQSGFTIVEVLVSAVMVVIISGGVLTGLEASGRASADTRDRARAQELAQQDQDR